MKILLFSLLLPFLLGCSVQKKAFIESPEPLIKVLVLQGNNDTLWIKVPENSTIARNQLADQRMLIIGKLLAGSRIQLQDGIVMMTQISMQESVSPESGYITIQDGQEGKWALVSGHLAGDLYRAEIICVFDLKPESFSLTELEEGKTSIMKLCK